MEPGLGPRMVALVVGIPIGVLVAYLLCCAYNWVDDFEAKRKAKQP